jgi:GAF domain-containing protein
MNFFKSLLPSTIPPHLRNKTEREIAKESLLQSILLTISGILLVSIALAFSGIIKALGGSFGRYFILIFAAPVFVVTIFRRLSLLLRAFPMMFFLVFFSVSAFIFFGIGGGSTMLLIVFIVLAGSLRETKYQNIAIFVSLIIILTISYLFSQNILPARFPTQPPDSRNQNSWTISLAIFSIATIITSTTITNLVAGLENAAKKQAALADELAEEKESLEIRIQERTQNLERRSTQLRAVADISRNMSSILDQEVMFQQAVNLLKDRLDLYYAGIFIIEETGQFAVLRAGTGEAGRQMVTNGHRLEVGGTSMIGWSVSNRMPRIALDVGEEAVRFSNPLLPETRSELALPIISQNNAIGALTIQSTKPNAFDQDDILIFQGIADSFSVALENARLFQQTQSDLNEIRFLSRQYLEDSWGSFLEASGTMTSEFENQLEQASSKDTFSHKIPVLFRDQPIGEIVLETNDEILSSEDQQFVDAITSQAVMALESARLLQETQRQALQEEKINQISAQFTNAFDIQDVLETALKEISQLPSVSEIAVHLVSPESQPSNNGSEVHK